MHCRVHTRKCFLEAVGECFSARKDGEAVGLVAGIADNGLVVIVLEVVPLDLKFEIWQYEAHERACLRFASRWALFPLSRSLQLVVVPFSATTFVFLIPLSLIPVSVSYLAVCELLNDEAHDRVVFHFANVVDADIKLVSLHFKRMCRSTDSGMLCGNVVGVKESDESVREAKAGGSFDIAQWPKPDMKMRVMLVLLLSVTRQAVHKKTREREWKDDKRKKETMRSDSASRMMLYDVAWHSR